MSNCVVLVLLYLRRIPNIVDVYLDFSTLGGLAERPILLDVAQLASSGILISVILIGRKV